MVTSRRSFIRGAALAAIGAGGLAPATRWAAATADDGAAAAAQGPVVVSTWGFGLPGNERALAEFVSGGTALDAVEQGIRRVCMDDRKGRRAALAVGLDVVGSLGLLARAKQLGIVPAVRPLVDRLSNEGAWYDAELLRRFLGAIGE